MTRAKTNLARVALQDQILAKWSQERIDQFRAELCAKCIFRELHGRPCHLLPIQMDGRPCQYFSQGDQYPREIV